MPHVREDRFTLIGFNEAPALADYLATRPTRISVALKPAETRGALELTQLTAKHGSRTVTVHLGDTIGFHGQLLVVDRGIRSRKDRPGRPDGEQSEPPDTHPEPEAEATSPAAARRAAWNTTVFATGYHPMTKEKLAEDAAPLDDADAPGSRCGTCRFLGWQERRDRLFPKCLNPGNLGAGELEDRGYPFASRGGRTDVDLVWPACALHSSGEPALSPDAARHIPGQGARA